MPPAYGSRVTAANAAPAAAGEQLFGASRTGVRAIDAVMRVAQRLWPRPRKLSAELAHRTGRSPRAVEYWLARRCGLDADAFAELIGSDAGLDVIDELMAARAAAGRAIPGWYPDFRRQAELSNLRRRLNELRRRFDAFEGG